MYISTPLYEFDERIMESPCSNLPWTEHRDTLDKDVSYPDLRTFSYICKIRTIQSFFMHMIEKDELEGKPVPLDLEIHMLRELREWENDESIRKHRYPTKCPSRLSHLQAMAD
jgi:hypothetical protein